MLDINTKRRALHAAIFKALGLSAYHRIGAQCQFDSGEMLRFNRVVKSKAILVIDVLKREFLEKLVSDNPGVMIIFRPWPDSPWADEPEHRAAEYVGQLCREIGPVSDLIHAVVDNNEYIHAHQTDLHGKADRYMAAFIELCHTKLGKAPVVLNASTGNFGDDLADCFPRMLQALKQWGGYIGFHEYDWPDMWRAHQQGLAEGNEGMWHCLRWKRAARSVRAAMGGWCPQFIITECGLDSHVIEELTTQPHKGFRDVYPDQLEQSVDHFMGSIDWYYNHFDDDVFAAILFGCGMVDPWGPFNIADTDVADRIALFPSVPVPPPEPPPPPEEPDNGGEDMDLENIKVVAWDEANQKHVELKTLAEKTALVKAKYGVEFRRANVAAGQKVYRLVELWEKSGNSSLITQVLDEQGRPMAKVDVAFYWPDAPDPPDPPTTVYPHDWYRKFTHGNTNINGDVGPGMGRGAYHGLGEGGPHAVWPRDPNIPSDICEKLGMLAGTPHDHLDQKFQLMTAGGEEPPEPGNGGEKGMWKETSRRFTAGESRIKMFFSGGDLFDTRGDMRCGSWSIPDPVEPNVQAAIALFDTTYPEEENRTYEAWIYDMRTNERLSDIVACDFGPGRRGTYDVYLEWQEDGGEEPPPTPPPSGDGVVAVLLEKATRMRQDADDLEAAAASLERAKQLSEELADAL